MNSKDSSEFNKELVVDIDSIKNFDVDKYDNDTEKMKTIGDSELNRFIDHLYDDGESTIEKVKKERNFNESLIGKLLKFIIN